MQPTRLHKNVLVVRGYVDASSEKQSEGMNATDIAAIHALYVSHRQDFFTYALSITGNRESAEDAIHAVFERLLRGNRLPSDPKPYVFRSIRNAAFDAARRTKIRTDSIFQIDGAGEVSREGGEHFGRNGDLEPLLLRLSADEREALVLKFYSGLTLQEIADIRGVPLPTAASWHRRGLEQLKTILKAER